MEKKIALWAAKDQDGSLYFYAHKPIRKDDDGWWLSSAAFDFVLSNRLPPFLGEHFIKLADHITYENGPLEIELTIKVK